MENKKEKNSPMILLFVAALVISRLIIFLSSVQKMKRGTQHKWFVGFEMGPKVGKQLHCHSLILYPHEKNKQKQKQERIIRSNIDTDSGRKCRV